jgi:thymidine kinase
MSGSINLIIGSMMSGKSTALLQNCERAILASKKVIFVRNKIDTRQYISRFIKETTGFNIIKVSSLKEIPNMYTYDSMYIDEAQFFNYPEFVEDVKNLANAGVAVYIAGLNQDANQHTFKWLSDLIGGADTVTKLNAVCPYCGNDASITCKKVGDVLCLNGDVDISADEKNVEGKVSYTVLCRSCYNKFKTKYSDYEAKN